jgi:gluconate 5-dehydrogenase
MASDWLNDAETYRKLIDRIPLGRVAEEGDVSGPVLFFLDATSAFVTGQILYVDGGITATQ